jgi:hypothetical protein
VIRFGATALPGQTAATVAAFPKLRYMRDFGRDTDSDRLPELPPHATGKWLQKPPGCLLHVSWKDDVEELKTWLDGLQEDIWLTVWHEPMGDVTPTQYRTNAQRALDIIAGHRNGHFVARVGPVVTRYWLVSKGGNPADWWMPGFNLYGIDVYNDHKSVYRDSVDLFAAAFDKVRHALPGVQLCVPEFGLALLPGDDGTVRSQMMRSHVAWLRRQPDLLAVGWWDIGGNRITGKEPEQGVWRTVLEEPMAWYLNRALTNLRAEVNASYPDRDRTSDGTIGDAAHQSTSSDHNPDPDGSVDAWDMDVDGVDVWHIIERFEQHEAARYWIYNGQIASRSNGWRRERYTGANPHDRHVHFNTREGYEDSREPWGIEEDDVVTAADVWNHRISSPALGFEDKPAADLLKAGYAAERKVDALRAEVAVLRVAFTELANAITDAGGSVDTAALLAAIDTRLAALPDATADAVVAEIAS